MNELLLIAADLEERRLLYAQLLETGYDVLPLPSLPHVMRLLSRGMPPPPAILIDVGSNGAATPELVEQLLAAAPGVPVIVIVGAASKAAWDTLTPRLAALLHRPISVREIVEVVRRIAPLRAGNN